MSDMVWVAVLTVGSNALVSVLGYAANQKNNKKCELTL